MPMKGNLIVLSGPSGTGKGTVCKKLVAFDKNIFYSVSATTRQPRPSEKDGREYYFVSKKEFTDMIETNKLLEWAKVYDNYYGTPLEKIKELNARGKDVLLEIDTQGALKVMEKVRDAISIFLLPPSLEELERRIRGRGTETQEIIRKRLNSAVGEIALGEKYDYLVVNKNVSTAVKQVINIVEAERCRTKRNLEILERVKMRRYDYEYSRSFHR